MAKVEELKHDYMAPLVPRLAKKGKGYVFYAFNGVASDMYDEAKPYQDGFAEVRIGDRTYYRDLIGQEYYKKAVKNSSSAEMQAFFEGKIRVEEIKHISLGVDEVFDFVNAVISARYSQQVDMAIKERNDKMLKAALDKYIYEIAAAKRLSLKASKKKAEEVATI